MIVDDGSHAGEAPGRVGAGQYRYGAVLRIAPADPRYDVVLERASDVGFTADVADFLAPGTAPVFVIPGADDGVVYYYRAKAAGLGLADSAWTAPIAVRNGIIPRGLMASTALSAAEAERRLTTLYGSDGALAGGTRMQDDTGGKQLARGRLSGTARHGDVVVFSAPFGSAPMMLFRGGLTSEQRAKWGATGDGTETGAFDAAKPVVDDTAALNLTAAGFTLRARLRQPAGSPTARSDAFSGGAVSAVGDTRSATLATAPGTNDVYAVGYSVALAATGAGAAVTWGVTIAIDSSADGGSTWTERALRSYSLEAARLTSESDTSTDSVSLTVSGLSNAAPADKFRIRIVASGRLSGSGSGSATITPGAVTYTTGSGDAFASKTPDTSTVIQWEAIQA